MQRGRDAQIAIYGSIAEFDIQMLRPGIVADNLQRTGFKNDGC